MNTKTIVLVSLLALVATATVASASDLVEAGVWIDVNGTQASQCVSVDSSGALGQTCPTSDDPGSGG